MLWEWWERYRRLLVGIGALFFLGSSVWLYHSSQGSAQEEWPLTPLSGIEKEALDSTIRAEEPKQETLEVESPPPPILVDVKGKVKNPGLYSFQAGMRVADAIRQAGGSLPDADLEQINLAQPLLDGAAVVIPSKSDTEPQTGNQAVPGQLIPSSSDPAGQESGGTININTATAAELMSLPGIGEAKAQAILQYRTEKQGFRSPEDLKRISGIGDKMYERLKDRIRIR